jgi:hypothetical protein
LAQAEEGVDGVAVTEAAMAGSGAEPAFSR